LQPALFVPIKKEQNKKTGRVFMAHLSIGSIPREAGAKAEQREDQELLGVQTSVEPDGSVMLLTLHTTEGSIRISVPFGQASNFEADLHQAALLMLYRQTAHPAGSQSPIADLIRAAVRPSKVSVGIDRATGDRLFLQEFGGERLPRVVRMSPDAVNETISELETMAAAHAN
jgi:hypothetical protein